MIPKFILAFLVAVSGVHGVEWSYDISLNALIQGMTLPGGDVIELTVTDHPCIEAGRFAVKLELQQPVSKWKGIYLHLTANDKKSHMMNVIQGVQKPYETHIMHSQLALNELVLWKDKAVGGKSAMYRIMFAERDMFAGKLYSFLWITD